MGELEGYEIQCRSGLGDLGRISGGISKDDENIKELGPTPLPPQPLFCSNIVPSPETSP